MCLCVQTIFLENIFQKFNNPIVTHGQINWAIQF